MCRVLFVVGCLMAVCVVRNVLSVECCLVFVVRCLLPAEVCCSCCLLVVGCCVLFVGRCPS